MNDLIDYLNSISLDDSGFIKKGKHFYIDDVNLEDLSFEFIVDENMKPIKDNVKIVKKHGFKCGTTLKNKNGSWTNVVIEWPDGLHRFMCG